MRTSSKPKTEPDQRRGVSCKEATRLLGIGFTKLYELMRAGDIQSYCVGARRFVLVQSIDAYVAARSDAAKRSGFQSLRGPKPWTRKRATKAKARRLRDEAEA
jgi:hypothetical protein